MRGGVNNPDIFFQNREAVNSYYDKLPDIVQDYMDKISEYTGPDAAQMEAEIPLPSAFQYF